MSPYLTDGVYNSKTTVVTAPYHGNGSLRQLNNKEMYLVALIKSLT
jgi:hypothetical protein